MFTFTALLAYDDPTRDDIVVTHEDLDGAFPEIVEIQQASALPGTVDVFQLADTQPGSRLAIYHFRHTRGPHSAPLPGDRIRQSATG